MPSGLKRFQHSGQSHFVTFSCFKRQPFFNTPEIYDLFEQCLDMRRRFEMCVYGYAVMPEHVHLLVNEPPKAVLADAIHYLKLSFSKRVTPRLAPKDRARTWGTIDGLSTQRSLWQKRYYDRNIRNAREFSIKLRYLHRKNRGQTERFPVFRRMEIGERPVCPPSPSPVFLPVGNILITLPALDRPRYSAHMFALTIWDDTSHLECAWAFSGKKELQHG